MFPNNSSESPRNEINVNTGVESFWSPLSSLSVGCYNDKISLRWLPVSGVDERGITRYDKNARISTCLSHTKTCALLRKYDEVIKPLVDAKADPGDGKTVMIPINSKTGISGLFIEYKNDENGVPSLYLTFAKNLSEVGAPAESIIRYKFGDLTLRTDMSPETGGGVDCVEHAEFNYFVELLRAHVLMTGLNSHAMRYSNAFSRHSGGGNSNYNQNSNSPMNAGMDAFSSGMLPDTDDLSVFQ